MNPTPTPVARAHHHRTPPNAPPLGNAAVPYWSMSGFSRLGFGGDEQDAKRASNLPALAPTDLVAVPSFAGDKFPNRRHLASFR